MFPANLCCGLKTGFLFLCFLLCATVTRSQNLISGRYTGDGNDNRVISMADPDIVIIKGNLNVNAVIRTSLVSGDNTKLMSGGGWISNAIQQMSTVGGIELGTANEVNKSGSVYEYIALYNQGSSFTSGSYTGNGSSSQAITGLGFQPDFLFILSAGNTGIVFVNSGMTAGQACDLAGNCGLTGRVYSLDSDGFTVGNNAATNNSSVTYYWIAGKNYNSVMCSGSYTGTGLDSANFNTCSLRPGFFLTKVNANRNAVYRLPHITGDSTLLIGNGSYLSGGVKTITDSSFRAGTDNKVNESGTAYYYIAFGTTNSPLALELIDFKIQKHLGGAQISWTVAEASEFSRFVLERSSDQENFDEISHVVNPGLMGAQGFQAFDPNPLQEISFYRIRMISPSGSMAFSDAMAFSGDASEPGMRVFPNPSDGNTVQLYFATAPSEDAELDIFDIHGTTVLHSRMGDIESESRVFRIPVPLSPGMYFVSLAGDGLNLRRTFLVK